MQDVSPNPSDADEPIDPEQSEIDASKAPLMDHLIELRQRLIYSLVAIAVMFVLCFAVADQILDILTFPMVWVWPENWPPPKLIITDLLEYFFTKLKVALFAAAFLAFPIIALQVYRFVAPGLYKNERQAFRPYLLATPVMFAIGAAIVYFLAMPLLVKFSISQLPATDSGKTPVELLPKVNEYLTLNMRLIFGFGLLFQLPVVLTLLARAGMLTADNLRSARRYAVVGLFGVAAVLTPPDPFSMIAMALPGVVLYEISIYAAARAERQRNQAQSSTPASSS